MKSKIVFAATSGLLLWASFAPLALWPAAFFGLGLLFWVLVDLPFAQRFWLTFTAGFTFFSILLHWSSTYVGAMPWLILAMGQSLIFSLLAILPIKRSFNGVLLFGAGFLLLELVRMKLPFGGFGWGRIGFTQVESFGSSYALLGVSGISLMVALCSAMCVLKPRFFTLLPIAVILSALISPSSAVSDDGFKIIAVQGGVDQLGFDYNDRAIRILDRHIAATPINTDADLILWPENSVDVDPRTNNLAQTRLETMFNQLDSHLLTGTVEQSRKGPINASNLYNPEGVVVSSYQKQDLAPFGEYIPMRWLAELISPYAKQVRDFVPGTKWSPHQVGNWRFQSFICFEVLDDDHVRAGAEGMDFLVAQTNNATFGDSAQAAQQLQITRARAAEIGKDFAVVSTTGYSAHIDENGRVVQSAQKFEPTALSMTVNKASSESLASNVGSRFWLILTALMLALGLRTRWVFIR